jgi:hypothetical protein
VRSCGKRLEDVGRGSGARGEGEGIAGMLERSDCFLKVVAGDALVLNDCNIVAETYRFGFEDREYSYSPTGFPTLVCAKVVDSEICVG